ncbi:MAG TPA: hypothetical protein VGE07_25690 [Herpetosiphonaceae bacterium]
MLLALIALITPSRPALAVIRITKQLTDTSAEFAAGKFGLTGLTQEGGVQLVPLGVLRDWTELGNGLCYRATDMGFASFGHFIYVVGGTTSNQLGQPQNMKTTCSTKVIDEVGTTEPWHYIQMTFPDIPHPANPELPEFRTGLAAVAVPLPGSSDGMLYAIGGRSDGSGINQSNKIYASRLNGTTGDMGAWAELTTTPIPDPDGDPNAGRENMSVTSYTNDAGETFIFLMGGYYQTFGTSITYRDIWRTKVKADGTLEAWVRLADIPIPSNIDIGTNGCTENIGLHRASVINFDAVNEQGSYRMIAIMGGVLELGSSFATTPCVAASRRTANVYLGQISQSGAITWQTPTSPYVLPEPLSDSRAIGVNQKLYIAAGNKGAGAGAVTNEVFGSYVTTELTLPSYSNQGNSTNFLQNTTALNVNEARASHGMVLVNYNYIDAQNRPVIRPLAYLFGGTASASSIRSDVLVGRIGTDDDTAEGTNYATEGLYQSAIYDLRAPARVESLNWTASVANATIQTDIKMQYRLGNSTAEVNGAAWNDVDGDTGSGRFSVNGPNIGTGSATALGRFIQYRAILTTNTPADRTATPSLDKVSVTIVADGHPSLIWPEAPTFPTIVFGQTIAPTIKVSNKKRTGDTSTETVLDAELTGEGTLFVDLFVFPPGVSPVVPPRNAQGQYDQNSSVAFAEINKTALFAGADYTIPQTLWKRNCPVPSQCPPVSWASIFNRTGTWRVVGIVDSGNNVEEADNVGGAWENDNVIQFTVVSQINGGAIWLPLMGKNGFQGAPLFAPPPLRNSPNGGESPASR